MREKVLAKVVKDRESRLAGKKPTGLAMLTKAGTNPVLRLRLNAEELQLVATEERMVARFQVAVTVETYYNLLTWNSEEIIKSISRTPVLGIVPGLDTWCRPERQKAMFEGLQTGKQVQVVEGKGHLTLFNGEGFEELMKLQIDFLLNEPKASPA